MNKLLIMPLKSLSFLGAMTMEWHFIFDAFFFTHILKIDEQRFLYIDPWDSGEIIKNLDEMLYKFCKPAACRFMKMLTHLQRFAGFSLLCR